MSAAGERICTREVGTSYSADDEREPLAWHLLDLTPAEATLFDRRVDRGELPRDFLEALGWSDRVYSLEPSAGRRERANHDGV
jgi:hypothetical protein